uniref:galactinol--sucrose galactosyltransferase n=1 Tax=Kalanchoe fedtschenkoi TaxID=63787 RepID=A0A7N0U928_KALFE
MAPNLTKAAGGGGANTAVDGGARHTVIIDGSNFTADGHVFLSRVPGNITAGYTSGPGCFVGFRSDEPRSRHVAEIGKLEGIRFMSIFRFKVWWTTLWVGQNGSELEHETQMVLLEKSDSGRPYVVMLPIISGSFRASIQPGSGNQVALCVESGSSKVVSDGCDGVLYLRAGDDPFSLVKEAVKEVRVHLGTFRVMDEKAPPSIVDKFGWCTWDAFYLTVHPQGVWEGVKELTDGGCPPGLVLIDDGWQAICHDDDEIDGQDGMNRTSAGEQMPCRLIRFEENHKFKNYQTRKRTGSGRVENGMGAFVRDLKEEFGVEYVYVWHALCGYWGGLRPDMPTLPESKVVQPKLTPGLKMTMEDLAVDKIVNNGIGLVPPEIVGEMYEGLHSHLESVGIDGVKVDVIHLLEMLSEDYGGRVELAKAYFKALTASVRKHFKGNGVIASMEHCNDFMLLGTEAIALGRVGDDFWSDGVNWLQGCHMVHCAYNSLWMGNFIQPDWDMFQTKHSSAQFHAASRAISGGPIYVSDKVGEHDFELLKSFVLPDGSLLRCDHYALPTRDCLFEDPLHDGKTMLKIWNYNKFTGVIGAFNCQGGGWSREERTNRAYPEFCRTVSSTLRPDDIEWTSGRTPIPIGAVETFAMYSFHAKKLVLAKRTDSISVTLEPFSFELVTVSPVATLPGTSIQFAPIGLVNMLNSGGAVQSLELKDGSAEVGVRGGGELRVFASRKPRCCRIGGQEVDYLYEELMVVVQVAWPGSSNPSSVEYLF